jgi:hypothetical protein
MTMLFDYLHTTPYRAFVPNLKWQMWSVLYCGRHRRCLYQSSSSIPDSLNEKKRCAMHMLKAPLNLLPASPYGQPTS